MGILPTICGHFDSVLATRHCQAGEQVPFIFIVAGVEQAKINSKTGLWHG